MSERNQGHVRVVPAKNEQYKVITVAENGEVLSHSESLTSMDNVYKNIKAQLHLYGGDSAEVRIFSGRPKSGATYKEQTVWEDGTIDDLGEQTLQVRRAKNGAKGAAKK